MSEEGEFKKRIVGMKTNCKTARRNLAITDKEKRIVYAVFDGFLTDIEEAAKEFPFRYFTEEGAPMIVNRDVLWQQVLDCVQWFVKWFKDSNVRSKETKQ